MRQRNWDIHLSTKMAEHLYEPFDWETSNCGHLMADAVEACHGKSHPAIKEISRFKTKTGALRILRNEGGLSKIIEKYFDEINQLSASTGDIAIKQNGDIQAGCVIIDGVAIGKSEDGLYRVPINTMDKIYRV